MNTMDLGLTHVLFEYHSYFFVGEKLRYYLQSKRDPQRHSSPIFMNCCAKRYCRHIASKMF